MSGFLPVGTTLQLSNSVGDINHQGILGSNLNGTPTISSFPISNTGTSSGHYHFFNPSSKAVRLLSAGADENGGHEFYVSNSRVAPTKTATIDLDGLTIDREIETATSLLALPNVTNSTDISLFMASSISVAPYNMTPNNSIFPVQVNSNCTNMVTGTIYYAKVFNATTLQLNTSLDGAVPTIIDTSDLATRPQPILSLVQGITTITKTSHIDEQRLNIYDNTNESVLTSTDLTFNNVSLKSQVATNTSNIATNTSNIATNTSNIATNTSNIATNTSNIATNTSNIATNTSNINVLQVKQTNLIYQFSSPAIYADGQPPSTTPTSIVNSYSINSWYFKNTVAGQKINWYMPTTSGLKVQDILGLYLRLFNVSTTSNDNTLFLTVYTTPDAGPNYSWYKSRMTYVLNQSITPTVNTLYTFFMNASGTCPNPSSYASTLVNMQASTVNNPRGTYGPTENIMFFSIGSNSASAVNSVEVVVQKFGVMTPTGTQEFQFAPLL